MNTFPIFSLALAAGIAVLVWSAGRFVHEAAATARLLGISPLVIGLTVVALGTSAPEIFTSAAASLSGAPQIAIGNVIGSNIANIGLILGCTLLVTPTAIPTLLIRRESLALVLATLGTGLLFSDSDFSRIDACVLLLTLPAMLRRMSGNWGNTMPGGHDDNPVTAAPPASPAVGRPVLLMLVSLALMVASSNVLVWGARNLAVSMGVSELVIGLTIVAVGTSLPELAASVASVLKNHHELAIGNVVGSNILNLLVVLPVAGLSGTIALDPLVLRLYYPALLVFTLLLAVLIRSPGARPGALGRRTGAVFIVLYLAYTAVLVATHDT